MRPVLFALLATLALSAPAAHAQTLDPSTPVSSEAVVAPAPEPAGALQSPVGGLPERAAPPRTLRAYWHVFAAFAVVWLLLFGYVLWLGRRFGQLEHEFRRVREVAG